MDERPLECAERGLAFALMTLERLKAVLEEVQELEEKLRREIRRLEHYREKKTRIIVQE